MEQYVGILNNHGEILYLTSLKAGVNIDNFNSFSKDYDLDGSDEDKIKAVKNVMAAYRFAIFDKNIKKLHQSLGLSSDEALTALIGYLQLLYSDSEESYAHQISVERKDPAVPGKFKRWAYLVFLALGFAAMLHSIATNFGKLITVNKSTLVMNIAILLVIALGFYHVSKKQK